MSEGWEQIRVWRARAVQVRQAAEAFDIPSIREGMIVVADKYDRLAHEV
jgi:hypothetical protein